MTNSAKNRMLSMTAALLAALQLPLILNCPACAKTLSQADQTGNYEGHGGNELHIKRIEGNKLYFNVLAFWPKAGASNEHMGELDGIAVIEPGGNSALFSGSGCDSCTGSCRIQFTLSPGVCVLNNYSDDETADLACGFGANVTVSDVYLRPNYPKVIIHKSLLTLARKSLASKDFQNAINLEDRALEVSKKLGRSTYRSDLLALATSYAAFGASFAPTLPDGHKNPNSDDFKCKTYNNQANQYRKQAAAIQIQH